VISAVIVRWDQNKRSDASNQADLQSPDALKCGITCDHHGFRLKFQAASRLRGMGTGVRNLWSPLSLNGQRNDRGAQFHNQQTRLGKQRRNAVQANLIPLPEWSNTRF
jgi:hypothetical protein